MRTINIALKYCEFELIKLIKYSMSIFENENGIPDGFKTKP